MSRRAAGFTLIEVMVALIVLVLGVLARRDDHVPLKDSKQSGLREQATAYDYELSDIMRANPPQYAPTSRRRRRRCRSTPNGVRRRATTTVPACYVAGCTRARWRRTIIRCGSTRSRAPAAFERRGPRLPRRRHLPAHCDGLRELRRPRDVRRCWSS